ncbi:MAG: N-acetylglucosamine-6-phosphate deacetylase [Myxococcota bacterium]|jgi:N-acetylglucosamine-6-phosphate deacetylase
MKKGIQAKLYDGKQFCAGWLTYDKGVIEKVSFRKPSAKRAATLHDLQDRCFIPGFVDTLLHGYAGVDCGEGTAARLHKMTQVLAQTGVTTALAGFYPMPNDDLQRAAGNWDKWSKLHGKRTHIAGWHVEGPFIAREMSGALPKSAIRKASPKSAQEFIDACGGWLQMTTLAPEIDGVLEACEILRANQVMPSIGHSSATALDCAAVKANGKLAATHLGNRMTSLTAREMGPIGFAMDGGIDYVAVIPDMVHVAAETLSLWAGTTKLRSRLMACSDNLSHAGTRAKNFKSGGKSLSRSGSVAIDRRGNLGGTLDSLPELLLRAHRDGVLSFKQVVSMGCEVAGDMLGDCGRLKEGRRADFVEYIESENKIGQVWVKGRKI